MGECKMQLGDVKDAIQYFSNAVRIRPKGIAGWEALIKCLYGIGLYPEAKQQAIIAFEATNNKPVFLFYLSAVLFALNKPKEALLQLEKAMSTAPKGIKKFVAINPSLLQNQQVVDIIAKYKRRK
jgi:tetratricopeptide (TPR) repeat protein